MRTCPLLPSSPAVPLARASPALPCRYMRGVLVAATSLTVAELEEQVSAEFLSGASSTPRTPETRTEFVPEEPFGANQELGRSDAIAALLERAHKQVRARAWLQLCI